uniref:Candidate secreted effector n=1 Tax=Meloidogyne incognita TaxID=6306 RepID=A0A914MI65_MELIC
MTEKGSTSSDLGPNESEEEIVNLQTKLDKFEIEFKEEKEKNEKEKKLIESRNKKEMKIFEKKMNEEIQKVKSEHENEIKNLKEYFQQLIDEKIKIIEKQKNGESTSEIKKFGGMNFIQVKNKWSITSNSCENTDKNSVPVGVSIEENEFVNLIGGLTAL